MHRQVNIADLDVTVGQQPDSFNLPVEQRQRFAKQLRLCLHRFYGEKLPSCPVIARDFCLRSPRGESISGESMNKWITGRAMPHSQRLRVLIDWLGMDLASSLIKNFDIQESNLNSSENDHIHTQPRSVSGNATSDHEITLLIKNLSDRDRQLVLSILKTMLKPQTGK